MFLKITYFRNGLRKKTTLISPLFLAIFSLKIFGSIHTKARWISGISGSCWRGKTYWEGFWGNAGGLGPCGLINYWGWDGTRNYCTETLRGTPSRALGVGDTLVVDPIPEVAAVRAVGKTLREGVGLTAELTTRTRVAVRKAIVYSTRTGTLPTSCTNRSPQETT